MLCLPVIVITLSIVLMFRHDVGIVVAQSQQGIRKRLTTSTGSYVHDKLEELSPLAIIIPKQYVITISNTVLDINDFIVSLISMYESNNHYNKADEYDDTDPILYVYDFVTLPSKNSTYNNPSIRGIALRNVDDTILLWLMNNQNVVTITPDYIFDLDNIQMEPENWGLDRIDSDQSGGPSFDQQYHYSSNNYDKYSSPSNDVHVYLLDTGLFMSHTDFSTITDPNKPRNISCGYDAFHNDDPKKRCMDTNGHGTHIGGIIGGIHHGVAKHANIISVKVYDDSSTYGGASLSTILAGLQYVLHEKYNHPDRPAIINLSLSGPACNILNMIATHIVEAGNITMIVSAGNDSTSSCSKSPPSAELPIITVSATNYTDMIPPYANYGPCTNIMAPGHAITSAWIRDSHDAVRLSGTSMAAAHVTGVAALHLQRYPQWTPYDVWLAIQKDALVDMIPNIPESTPDLILNIGILKFP